MKYFNEERLVIKSWCDSPAEGALQQARNLANLPFLFKQVCLMPDVHQGYGMPIGGVIAANMVVIPNAVGVDIGCGVKAVKTTLHKNQISREKLKTILGLIRNYVPVGFNHHKEPHEDWMPELPTWNMSKEGNDGPRRPATKICEEQYKPASYQIGSLGGGNHFIEIQQDQNGRLWFMIHSGSRNLGKKVADYYNDKAQALNAMWQSGVPREWELAFLPMDTYEGKQYLKEMAYCLQFAEANRNLMASFVMEAFQEVAGGDIETEINIHHNYAAMENHFGQNVLVHRKGATRARAGEVGIIPGSQGTRSYIVEGLGNPESFMSCSHGAGRRIGRKEAVRSLDFDAEVKLLEDKGIIHALRGKNDLEEASGAYKDIAVVMTEQMDLVKPIVELEPLAVIKG